MAVLLGHVSKAWCCDVSCDGLVAVGSSEGTLLVWDCVGVLIDAAHQRAERVRQQKAAKKVKEQKAHPKPNEDSRAGCPQPTPAATQKPPKKTKEQKAHPKPTENARAGCPQLSPVVAQQPENKAKVNKPAAAGPPRPAPSASGSREIPPVPAAPARLVAATTTAVQPRAPRRSAEEVGAWIGGIGLPEYSDLFVKNEIDGEALLCITEHNLQAMGITKVGHQIRILSAVKRVGTRSHIVPMPEGAAWRVEGSLRSLCICGASVSAYPEQMRGESESER